MNNNKYVLLIGMVMFIARISHTQIQPTLLSCEDMTFGLSEIDIDNDGELCEAHITLTNVGEVNDTICTSSNLSWQIIVDTWGGGSPDLEYTSYVDPTDIVWDDSNGNGIPDTYIPYTASGESVSIVLDDISGSLSNHKITWSAEDDCSNTRNCAYDFFAVDFSKPLQFCGSEDGECHLLS